jgi:hypothetical protein
MEAHAVVESEPDLLRRSLFFPNRLKPGVEVIAIDIVERDDIDG